MTSELLHPDRLFPVEPAVRQVAREIYQTIKALPIISPHGHTEARWFAENLPFENPSALFITPDHYVFRMLYSQGIPMENLGVPDASGATELNPRKIWHTFAQHYQQLYRATPTRLWIDHALHEVLRVSHSLNATTADQIYDEISHKLSTPAFLPRTLFERFNIEVLATTESAVDSLTYHQHLNQSEWKGRVITTFRPDSVTNPEHPDFQQDMQKLAELTGQDPHNWHQYLEALRVRRRFFAESGATATDHGFPTPYTTILSESQCQRFLTQALEGTLSAGEAEQFRGHMLVEMARMSLQDGLVMQLHTGSCRNHNAHVFDRFGMDKGCDIPRPVNFVEGLEPLLNDAGNHPELTLIVFTLDESTYSRELAPLAGHYPAMKLGPPWWFHDSPEGMLRYRQQTTETAGFYNTVGFNDDTRAFLSIPARHDVARRMDSRFLADLVCEHRMTLDEAIETAHDLTYRLPKEAYKL
ncbi:glucuronate isomerase [Endozoicomonas numazuensis]|uniref:Uronate isomerase n=1 Tax=Endozoicomonas numazuensis TaxID=1137799 RepID=A0A081N6A2_9GAMM|nr:glucuronate isomerase [Endozoicomonas numazuensis]KEQ13975.1 glucuronate isomerase [Endozoicomonas numazuensis]